MGVGGVELGFTYDFTEFLISSLSNLHWAKFPDEWSSNGLGLGLGLMGLTPY